jgi:HEAT repeat protein
MGIDGWLYIAVGDYGFVNAEGTDGRRISQRGGSIVRVRPDGSELEVYATGLRNVYDIALDPFMNGFERGNTNDGYGWRVRLQHIVPQAEYGYPSLFRYFAAEVLPPLADYGGGSGTGALFVDTPHLPDSLGHTLYTVDWGRGSVFQHGLRAHGATFQPTQQTFLQIPVPTDMTIDGRSNLYVSSWMGASFWYATEDVGFIARLTHEDASPEAVPNFADASTDQLVDLLAAPHSLHRLHAQQELLRRGPDAGGSDAVAALVQDDEQSLAARVAALFTLKQLAGAESRQTLVALLDDPALREFALRALADRKTQLDGVSPEPFITALSDDDPRVRLQAVNGLARLDAQAAAADMAPLVADSDRTVAHVAVQSLAQLGVADPLAEMARLGSPAAATGAHHVLQRIHTPASVDSLIAMWEGTVDPYVRWKALTSLARLYHREADWEGDDWWGTTPSTRGPYFEPVKWSESARIRPVLQEALETAEDIEYRRRAHLLELNRAVPNASNALLLAVADASDSLKAQTIRTLVGNASVTEPMLAGLDSLARRSPALQQTVTGLLVAQRDLPGASHDLLRRAALNRTMAPSLRAQALESLVRISSEEDVSAVTDVHAQLIADAPLPTPIAEAVREYAQEEDHAAHVAHFTMLARSDSAPNRKLAYTVLLHLAGNDEMDEQPRSVAREMIADGWSEDRRTASLLWAIGFTQHDDYANEVRQHLDADGDPAIHEAARYAAKRLGLDG